MTSGRFLCCGTRIWVKLFAWIQIICYSTGIVLLVLFLSFMTIAKNNKETARHMKLDEGDLKKSSSHNGTYFESFFNMQISEYHMSNIGFTGFVALYFLTGVMLLLGVISGVYLLRGAQKNKLLYLKSWIIFAFLFVLWVITLAVLCNGGVIIAIVKVLVCAIIYGFQALVVHKLIIEIEMEEEKIKNGSKNKEKDSDGNPLATNQDTMRSIRKW